MLRSYLGTALFLLASGFLTPANVASSATDVKDGAVVLQEKSWTLYHSVSSPTTSGGGTSTSAPSLERRGRVRLTVARGSDATIVVENDPHSLKTGFNSSSGWYRLTVVPDDDDDNDNKDPNKDGVATTVPVCQLRRANFRDELVLMLGENGRVLSLSYQPLVSPLAPTSCDAMEPLESPPEFQSRISYEISTPGLPLRHVLVGEKPPPGLKFLPYPKRPQQQQAGSPSNPLLQDGGDGRNQQQQQPDSPFGFMRRYWYIILPILLLNIMGGSPAPESPDQEAATPSQQGPSLGAALVAPAGAAAATSPSTRGPAAAASSPSGTIGTAKQRRGKRG